MSNATHNVEITTEKLPKAAEVLDLFRRLHWAKMDYRDQERFQRALERSWPIVTAWDGERLVGVCRCVTDGEYTAYISDLAVDPVFQGNGVGTHLVEKALELLADFDTITLITSEEKVSFWERFGFTNYPGAMMLRRW